MLLILVTFGDDYLRPFIGNLDTIFGLALWPVLDVIYPLASIVVFLTYGWLKGNGLKFNAVNSFLLISYLAVLLLVNIDDILKVFRISNTLPNIYWNVIMWIYPIYSALVFLMFGKRQEKLKSL